MKKPNDLPHYTGCDCNWCISGRSSYPNLTANNMRKYFGSIEIDGYWASWVEIEAATMRQAAQKTLMHFYDLGRISLGEPKAITVSNADDDYPKWSNFKGKVMTEVELLD